MALFIIIEIALGVVFASVMMFYLGLHLTQNKQVECSKNTEEETNENITDNIIDDSTEDAIENKIEESSNDVTEDVKDDVVKVDSSSKKKLTSYFNKAGISEVFSTIKQKKVFWLFFAMIAFSIGAWFYDMYVLELPLLKSYVNSIICTLVILMGYIDYKEHIIPNPLVLTGIGVWLIASILEIFVGGTSVIDLLRFSGLGFAVCGGLLLVLAVVLRSGLGMGDVKMFAMLGLIYGLSNTYSLLICTLIPMAIVAIVLLARKKVTRKSTLPMAPFTVLAFVIGILCGI